MAAPAELGAASCANAGTAATTAKVNASKSCFFILISCAFCKVSEEILQRKLHDPRVKRRNHLAECSAVEIRRRIVLPEAVGEVERLRSKLHFLRFLESEVSRERNVELPPPRTIKRAIAQIAQSAWRRF